MKYLAIIFATVHALYYVNLFNAKTGGYCLLTHAQLIGSSEPLDAILSSVNAAAPGPVDGAGRKYGLFGPEAATNRNVATLKGKLKAGSPHWPRRFPSALASNALPTGKKHKTKNKNKTKTKKKKIDQ